MPRLVIIEGTDVGRVFHIDEDAGIGRASSNLIRLNSTQVSQNHAQIFLRDGTYIVRDLESRNGVLVDGKLAREASLEEGTEIRIGNVALLFNPPLEVETQTQPKGEAVVLTEDGAATGVISSAFDVGEASIDAVKDAKDLDPEALKRAHDQLKVLFDLAGILNSVLDMDSVLDRLLDAVMDILEADRGLVMLRGAELSDYYPGAVKVRPGAEAIITVSRTILTRVVRHGKAILSSDAIDDPRFRSSESIQLSQVRTVMCVPLLCRDKTLGALYVDKAKPYKDFDEDDLRLLSTIAWHAATAVENARIYSLTRDENINLREIVAEKKMLVFASRAMGEVVAAVEKIAGTRSTVLIRGETGTGKEVIARLIHDKSGRASQPMICLNCAAVPESLLESELFGHEKGAFTGAHRRTKGKFEMADRGTLFLDEIGEISLAVQTKLLRVIEERRFMRVGGLDNISVDVRIIAASNRDLEKEVEKGTFREDLYYRLAVVPLHIPPLRQRAEDIPALVDFFLARFNREMGKRIEGFTPEAMTVLAEYPWPGNVRELQNLVEQVVVMSEGTAIEARDLPPRVLESDVSSRMADLLEETLNLPQIIEATERLCIERALRRARWKKIEAARLLNVSRPTLDKKIKKYGIDVRRD